MRAKRENIMLAYPADTGRISRLGPSFFAQPKYRGQRMRVEWFHDEPILLSSYGIEFRYFPHIKEELKKLPHLPYDGEAYHHGMSQEEINSICNRTVNAHPDSEKMQFHIFDYQGWVSTQQHRILRLLQIQHNHTAFQGDILQNVPTKIVTQKDWTDYLRQWMDEGYEGIILRKPESTYVIKRDVGLLKFKPTHQDTYKITGVLEAISKDGIPKGMIGAFIVTDGDAEFKVGAGKIPHQQRIDHWKDRDTLPGKMLLTKHEDEKTRHGVPICAVALEVIK